MYRESKGLEAEKSLVSWGNRKKASVTGQHEPSKRWREMNTEEVGPGPTGTCRP